MIWFSDRNWLQGLRVSSLAHMIREFSPKAKSMPLLIHIILILATLPSLQVLGVGGETLSTALKTFTPWHIPLSGYLLSKRWQYRFCWWMSIAKYALQKRASGTRLFSISLPWRVKQKSELCICVWKTKAHRGTMRRERDLPQLYSPTRMTLTFGTSPMPCSWVY